MPAYGPPHPLSGYVAPASARPPVSTKRAIWCAIGVVLAAVGSLILVGSLGLVLEFALQAGVGDFFSYWPFALGVPAAYWLGLVRLPYIHAGRAYIEVIGLNIAISLVFWVAILTLFGDIYQPQPGNIGLFNSYPEVHSWSVELIFAVVWGLVTGLMGMGLARAFARWKTIQLRTPSESASTLLLQALGGIATANLIFIAPSFISINVFDDLYVGEFGLFIMVLIAIALAWYASQSALRMMQRPALMPAKIGASRV